MKKFIGLSILLLITLFILVGCNESGDDIVRPQQDSDQNDSVQTSGLTSSSESSSEIEISSFSLLEGSTCSSFESFSFF